MLPEIKTQAKDIVSKLKTPADKLKVLKIVTANLNTENHVFKIHPDGSKTVEQCFSDDEIELFKEILELLKQDPEIEV